MATLADLKNRALALADLQTTGGDSYLSSDEQNQQVNLALEELEAMHDQMGTGRDRVAFGQISVAADTSEYDLSTLLEYTPYRILGVYRYIAPYNYPLQIVSDPLPQIAQYPMQVLPFPPVLIVTKPGQGPTLAIYPHPDMTVNIVYRWRYPVLVNDTDSINISEIEQQFVALTVAIYNLTKQERDASALYQQRELLAQKWPPPVQSIGPQHTGTTAHRRYFMPPYYDPIKYGGGGGGGGSFWVP